MTPQELHNKLAAKARAAAVDAEAAASASRRALAELAGTYDTINNARLARLPRPHIALLEALVEPDRAASDAAAAALYAATALRAAAGRAVADVGARHLELQAAGASGAFYRQATPAGSAPAAPRAAGPSTPHPSPRRAETMTAPTTRPITAGDALRAAAALVQQKGWRQRSSLYGGSGIDVHTAIRDAAASWQQGEEAIRRVQAYFRWHPEVAQPYISDGDLYTWNAYVCADQNAAVAMLLAAAAPTESW